MKFASILKRARTLAAEADISQVDFLAVQINIEGEENGVFYVEVKDGRISVEPYEYYDRQCAVTISDADFSKLTRGKLDTVKAYDEGKLRVEGDLGRAMQFAELLQSGIKAALFSKKAAVGRTFLPTALVKKTATGYNAYYEYTDALCAVVNKPMEEPGRISASALERMIE